MTCWRGRAGLAKREKKKRELQAPNKSTTSELLVAAAERRLAEPEPGPLIYGQSYGGVRTVDFPTVRFFSILISFLLFSDFKKFFQEKIVRKKILERKI